ncbi:MAG: peptidoglycan DD-metalloendopeptidase family protein [bacterium]
MKRPLLILLITVGCAAWSWSPRARWAPEAAAEPRPEASGEESQLKEIRQKIRKEKETLQQIAGKKKGLLDALQKLDQAISLAREDCRRTEEQIGKLQAEALKLGEELRDIEEQLRQQRKRFDERLVAYYRVGRAGVLPVVFSDGSFGEKVRSLESMKRILSSDRTVVCAFQSVLQEKESKARSLEASLEQKRVLQRRMQEREKEFLARKREKDSLLSDLEQDKRLHDAALKESRDAAHELERLIRAKQEQERKREAEQKRRKKEQEERVLASKPPVRMVVPDFPVPQGDSFVACKGKLSWPVRGELVRKFGKHYDPQFGSETINKGIDIKTRPESPVRSVWSGEVVYADWFRGYGKLMIIDHGGKSYSVLSHMSRLAKSEGERVEAGEIVGYAGDTGSLLGCVVHFEIWHRGSAQDPLDWVRVR